MKPFFTPFPALLAAASAWYCCCFCSISHAGSFYAEAFLAPPSSITAGHARSHRAVARPAASSARWHDKAAAAAAAAANTATCSATRSHHQHSLSRIPRTTTATPLAVVHHRGSTHQHRRHSTARRCALPEDAPEGSSADSGRSGAAAPTSNSGGTAGTERPVNGVSGVPSETTTVPGDTASPGAGGEPGRGGGGAGKGLEGRLISRLSRRVADSFPLLTADEIKNEIRALLNPETKAESKAASAGSARDESLSALVKEVRELVEELMEQVGVNEAKSLADLKDFTQKFKGVLRGDPATVQELRTKVLDDLEEVREEIAELIEVEELSKARERLEKATAESTEVVFDSVVAAMVTGLDTVINEGKGVIQEGEETETLQVSTYFYGKDNEFWDDMQANGVTPRRVFLYSLLGAGVAFGGNLFGVTSGVLGSLAPEASRDVRLDVLFPIGGFKRYYSAEDGYEFIYPQEWVGDSGLALKQQRDLEEMRAAPSVVSRARQRRAGATAPEVAFGPPGGDGGENVSVVKSELMGGFSLTGTLGKPKEAAEKLLSTFIAPPESGREWELITAFGETRAPGGLVYQFEYRIKGKGIRRPMHNVGVVVARGSTLFTVTVLAPEERWANGRGENFREVAKSFRLSF